MKKDISSSFLAYTRIKERIIDLTYQPAERLSETKLAEEFGPRRIFLGGILLVLDAFRSQHHDSAQQ